MFWLGIVPGPLQWEASTLEESHLNSLLTAIRNIYIWTRDGINYLPISDCIVRKNEFIRKLSKSSGTFSQQNLEEVRL